MSGMCSLEELSVHFQAFGFRPINEGEGREHYCRAWGAWMADRLVPLQEIPEGLCMEGDEE